MSKYEEMIGTVLDGRYRIDELLGEGGMAAVMKAYDLQEKRNVAVKMLRDEMAEDKQALKRFINESKAVSVMNHPNVVKAYDVVMTNDLKYIVMEYIEGESLRDYLDRVGPVSFEKTVSILSQILEALDHAHEKGVIHRDIKPQNIIMMKSGKVVVTDFGIAMIKGGENAFDDKTMGTVYYISPEQAEGEKIDERSDLYSLGVTLFEMLTGRLPFTGENTLDVAMKQIGEEPPSPRDILPTIPKGMEQIVLFALKKDPDERFRSARQMAQYLEALKNDPFAEFAISPKEQYRIALEEAEKKKRRKAESSSGKSAEDGVEEKRVKGDSWSLIPILVGISLAFFMVFVVAGYYSVVNIFWNSQLNVFRDQSGENVTVENYIGSAFTEADRMYLLEDVGYHKVTVVEEYSNTVPKGTVISQDPAGGEVRKKSTVELTVVVSKGSNYVESVFPDYSMQDYRQVRLLLEDQGYTVDLQPVESSAAASCLILRTVPAAGEKLPEDKKVTIFYSAGANAGELMFSYPAIVGMTETALKNLIKTNGLNLVSCRYAYSDTVAAGRVISSSIAEGPFPKLTPLSVVISLGVDPSTIHVPTPPSETPSENTEGGETAEETAEDASNETPDAPAAP